MQKKLLYLTSRVFWPAQSGHEVHIFNYIKALSEKYGYCVDVYILEKKATIDAALKNKPAFIRNIICGEKIAKHHIVENILCETILNREHWPIQAALYFDKANVKKLEELNHREHYDVLFVDMIRLAPYIRAFSHQKPFAVLDMGDLLSKRYRRQIANVHESSSVGGAYTSNMPKVVQSMLRPKWIQVAILKVENQLMEKAETLWAERYDSVILVSTVETEELNRKLTAAKAVTVHVGIDTQYFSEDMGMEKGSGLISFVGDMRTAANRDTVNDIALHILPLCKKVKQAVLVGKCPADLMNAYRQNERIHFTGMVPDVRKEIKRTNVFLAPMAYGTGVKIKIVEAMAMGMPVVTNPIGAEGIPGTNGVHWYVGNNEKEIAEYVDKLLSDPNHCGEMGQNAQQLADEIFSWDAATNAFAQAGL